MKQLVENVDGEGMVSLLGQVVTLMCANYFYTGTLMGVNDDFVKLKDPKIIYETGAWGDKQWADAQSMKVETLYVRLPMVESFGVLK
jgi:hypothetical protein